VLCLTLVGGCVSKEISHSELSGDVDTFASATAGEVGGFGSSGDFGFPQGNYPDPAVTRCGDVLGDLPAINSLASAWAVVAVPNATAGDEPVEAGAVLLRLSQDALVDCGSDPQSQDFFFGTSTGDGALEGRGMELMLAPQDVTLGVHQPASLTLYGDGATSEFDTEAATVELLRVDDDCVVGIVRGVESEGGTKFLEGGFVAETCQRQCIPTPGFSC